MIKATDTFSIVLKNSVRECARLRAAVDDFTETNKFPDDERFELQACLQEAVMDIVKRGFDDGDEHSIDVQMLFQRKRRILTIRIVDEGKGFNSFGENSPRDRVSQGPSQSLDGSRPCSVRRYADQMSWFRQSHFNHLILSRTIPEQLNSLAATPSA